MTDFETHPIGTAKRIDGLEAKLAKAVEALRDVTQALVWQCFGSCRGYSDNLLTSKEAEEVARATLAELEGKPHGED